jgi:hypothetical protein
MHGSEIYKRMRLHGRLGDLTERITRKVMLVGPNLTRGSE